MDRCSKCNKPLTQDEAAITRRLISRGTTEFLCIHCLAEYFKCDKALILERITHFKAMGCTLFSTD